MQDLLKCYLCKRDLDLLQHSEVDCLREQLRLSRLEVETWKEAALRRKQVASRVVRRLAQTAMHVVDEVRVKRETKELGAIGALQHDALMVQFNEEV